MKAVTTLLLSCLAVLLSPRLICSACDLQVYENGVESQHTGCVQEYGKDECITFVNSFNQSDLPVELQGSPHSGPPTALQLMPKTVFNADMNAIVQGYDLTWQTPISGLDRKFLKGFVLIHSAVSTTCRFFRLNMDDRPTGNLTFKYSNNRIRPAVKHTLKVYNLPAPGPSQYQDPRLYLMGTLYAGDARSLTPSQYRVAVVARPYSTGEIHVTIALSPPQLNFTQYAIKLNKKSYSNVNYFRKVIFITEVESDTKKTDTYVFSGLETDQYYVSVKPHDQLKWTPDCLCYSNGDLRTCNEVCQQVDTEWFDLTVTVPETTAAPSTLPPTTEPPLIEPQPSDGGASTPSHTTRVAAAIGGGEDAGSEDALVIGLLVAAAVLVIAIVVVICCYRKKCCGENK